MEEMLLFLQNLPNIPRVIGKVCLYGFEAKHTTKNFWHGFLRRSSPNFFIFLNSWGVCVSPLHKGLVNVVTQQRKPRRFL